jgi:hypothetical protein
MLFLKCIAMLVFLLLVFLHLFQCLICSHACRRLLDTEDELSDIQTDSVPSEVRDWLASTFTRKMGMMKKKPEEKPKFRSIVHAVQAGIFVER